MSSDKAMQVARALAEDWCSLPSDIATALDAFAAEAVAAERGWHIRQFGRRCI